jgi:RNase H-fold protein (predicted Holliday junction resolvase)
MFNYRKYQRGGYNRYMNNGKTNKQFRKEEGESDDSKKIAAKKSYFRNDLVVVGKNKNKTFYKSRKRKIKNRKTVRFSENLEQNFVLQESVVDENINKSVEEKDYDWDISIDFEELI